MVIITTDILHKIVPHVSGAKVRRQAEIIVRLANLFNISEYREICGGAYVNTPLRMAHFLAQIAHESDGFCTTEEYASGATYEGRHDLGNVKAGDGRRYKGRGFIQITGRKNYTCFYRWINERNWKMENPLQNPEAVKQFPLALLSAFWYWQSRDLNGFADADDLITITRIINGGLNGLNSRRFYLTRAKAALCINRQLSA